MNDQDIAIAAQMRAWLDDAMENTFNKGKDANNNQTSMALGGIYNGLLMAKDHLDTLTSKRWRVVEAMVEEAPGYVCRLRCTDGNAENGVIAYGYSYWSLLRPKIEPGTRVMIVTEEK